MRNDYHKGFNPKCGDVYPTTPDKQAAQFLKAMANDYLKEKTTKANVTEACQEWLRLMESEKLV
jgi:hypothetical protein